MRRRLFFFLCSTLFITPLFANAPPLHKGDQGGFSASAICGNNTGTTTTVGNLFLQTCFIQSSTITVSSVQDGAGGNTWHVIAATNTNSSGGSNNGSQAIIAWTVVTNAFNSCQINLSNPTSGDGSGIEYSGMASVSTVFDSSSTGSGNSSSLATSNITLTASNDVIVGVGGVMQNSASATAGTGFTIEQNNAHSVQGNSYAWEDSNSTSCGSQNANMTESVGGQWSMIAVAFKTSSPSSCGPPNAITSINGGMVSVNGGQLTIK